jgi:hypothetical protein
MGNFFNEDAAIAEYDSIITLLRRLETVGINIKTLSTFVIIIFYCKCQMSSCGQIRVCAWKREAIVHESNLKVVRSRFEPTTV